MQRVRSMLRSARCGIMSPVNERRRTGLYSPLYVGVVNRHLDFGQGQTCFVHQVHAAFAASHVGIETRTPACWKRSQVLTARTSPGHMLPSLHGRAVVLVNFCIAPCRSGGAVDVCFRKYIPNNRILPPRVNLFLAWLTAAA